MSAKILARRIHRWLGLLLALQLLLWLSGGVVMSLLPIEMVRGSHWVQQPEESLAAHIEEFARPPAQILDNIAAIQGFAPALRLGKAVYIVRGPDGARILEAGSGNELAPLDADGAAALARSLHHEHPEVAAVLRIEAPEGEARGMPGPVWRVDLADRWHTRIYLDPISARLRAVRNDIWRVYDFFWMLHIMDYGERDDFNNNLLRISAGSAWFFCLSGLWLLYFSFAPRKLPAGGQQGSRQTGVI